MELGGLNKTLVLILTLVSGNGLIEDKELDSFLKEFVGSVTAAETGPEVSKRSGRFELSFVRFRLDVFSVHLLARDCTGWPYRMCE